MHSRINELIQSFEVKRQKFLDDMYKEYEKLKDTYEFHFERGRVYFSKKVKQEHKALRKPLWKSFLWLTLRGLIVAPFIYAMIIPAYILDIFLFIFQNVFFRLYSIPLVNRKDYIVYDRKYLSYLNLFQKVNCIYCSYFNWLMSYAVEIAWRTEKFWCPIKNASKTKTFHSWQKCFADYGDAKWFSDVYGSIEEFKGL